MNYMGPSQKIRIALLIWLLVTLSLLLAPAPREWGIFGPRLLSFCEETRFVLQPAAHVLLMAAGTMILIRCFGRQAPRQAFLLAITCGLVLTVFFELLQSIIPESFARRCDAADLIPSAAGLLFGGAIGLAQRFRNGKDDE